MEKGVHQIRGSLNILLKMIDFVPIRMIGPNESDISELYNAGRYRRSSSCKSFTILSPGQQLLLITSPCNR